MALSKSRRNEGSSCCGHCSGKNHGPRKPIFNNLLTQKNTRVYKLEVPLLTFLSNTVSNLECKTEEQIKEHAKELFFSKGVLDASTQEIADFAGVNRTLVNYYFRSKKNLFHIVYNEAIIEMRKNYARIYVSELSFREKVGKLIDFTAEFRESYPFLEIFNIQETGKLSNQMETILQPKSMEETLFFLKEIEEEMKKGTIPTYEPVNFLINIISLISFPIVMKPIFKEIFYISSEEHYQRIYNQRKEVVMTILFNNVKQQ